MKQLFAALAGALVLAVLVIGGDYAYAAAIQPNTGGGGGLSQATADTLYCQLAGCTMTGATTYSAVTNDITSGANEDIRIRPNGTGRIRFQAGDNTTVIENSAGTQVLLFEMESGGTRARIQAGAGSAAVWLSDGVGGVNIGTLGAVGATNPVGVFSESISSATAATPVFSGFGAGKFGTRQAQTATCSGATLNLDIQSSVVFLTNSNAGGCAVTIQETSGVVNVATQIVVISNAGGTVTFPDVANVHAGPACADTTGLAVNDTYSLIYADAADDLYVGLGCGDN
jgi:hypothetical protein